jgi:hypothetical protein
VAALFEPGRQWQGHLKEVSESISQLTRLALQLCEPLKSFHELKKVVLSNEPLQAQFYALSKEFGDATDSKVTETDKAENSRA